MEQTPNKAFEKSQDWVLLREFSLKKLANLNIHN